MTRVGIISYYNIHDKRKTKLHSLVHATPDAKIVDKLRDQKRYHKATSDNDKPPTT